MMRGRDQLKEDVATTASRWVARRDAGMSVAEHRELQEWIAADPRHQAAWEFYESAWSVLAKPAEIGAGEEFAREIKAVARRRGRRVATAGAICVLLFCAYQFSGRWASDDLFPLVKPTMVILSPSRQTLPDGSEVELKADAQISVAFTPLERRIVLTHGEAYFSVRKDKDRSFVVAVGGVEVRAIGTQFSVQKKSTAVEVLVTDGRVAVAQPLAPDSTEVLPGPYEAMIDAGNRAVVDFTPTETAPEVRPIPAVELNERLAWRSVRLEFTKTPLVEAVEMLNRHAAADAARLKVADPRVAAMRITGIFRADNTDALVRLLEGVFGLKAERSGSVIELRKQD